MNNPLVSIIIPTFNRAHLIGETLDSVLAQTYTNWECIIVNDGSTDTTDEVVSAYVQKDNRFQYHHRPADRLKGGNAARNYGFELSKGEYINWFDSDDLMDEVLLEKKIELCIIDPNIEFVLCGFRMFENNESIFKNEWLVTEKVNITEKFLSKEVLLNTQVVLWKRNIISSLRFDEKLTRAQDLDFIFNAFLKIKLIFEIVPLTLVHIRIHNDTISKCYEKGKKEDIKSELEVRRYIFYKNIKNQDVQFKKKILILYLTSHKNSLKFKKYNIYFNEIILNNSLQLKLRTKLICIGLLFMFFGKGLHTYSKVLKI